MTPKITYLIVFYVLFIIGFIIFSLAGIYHLRRYGYAGDLTKPFIFIYSILAILAIAVTFFVIFYEIIGV